MTTIHRTLQLILLLALFAICEPSAGSTALAVNYVDVLAAIVSIITIIAAIGVVGKKIFGESESDKRLKIAEVEISSLKILIDTNHREMKDLVTSIRTELSDKSTNHNYTQLVKEHESLEHTVNEGIDKLNDAINELDIVEVKLNEIRNQFDDSNLDRKTEIKEINDTIKTLREAIRDDISEVRSIIMKMMLNLRAGNE